VTADSVWIDVGMWSPLSGRIRPFTDVQCEPPETSLADARAWQDWALAHLSDLARREVWQPARYHYTVESWDQSGRALDCYAHGLWEWQA
jgi:hypothetical protein